MSLESATAESATGESATAESTRASSPEPLPWVDPDARAYFLTPIEETSKRQSEMSESRRPRTPFHITRTGREIDAVLLLNTILAQVRALQIILVNGRHHATAAGVCTPTLHALSDVRGERSIVLALANASNRMRHIARDSELARDPEIYQALYAVFERALLWDVYAPVSGLMSRDIRALDSVGRFAAVCKHLDRAQALFRELVDLFEA